MLPKQICYELTARRAIEDYASLVGSRMLNQTGIQAIADVAFTVLHARLFQVYLLCVAPS